MDFPWKKELWLPGVLNKKQTQTLSSKKLIEIDENSIGFSSFDLRLSTEGYEMIKGSMKPMNDIVFQTILEDTNFAEKLRETGKEGIVLERGKCYVFKLKEKVSMLNKTPIYGQATAKSSIGRLDTIARLIVDGMSEYERFDPDYISTGYMYLEITPLSFAIKVYENSSLSQLRLFYGKIEDSILNSSSFAKSLIVNEKTENIDGSLSVDLTNTKIEFTPKKGTAYKARKVDPNEIIDLSKQEEYPPDNFWTIEESRLVKGKHRLQVTVDDFYILRSKEKICLPRNIAVYCKAMDESLGEMRIHYAGFVHPFFGYKMTDSTKLEPKGTPLIFEVRGHNVDVNLIDGEKLAFLTFYRMSDDASPEDDDTYYNDQVLKLSKYFQKEWNL